MAAINWLAAVSDNFSNAVRWAGGAVPGVSDDAILGVLGGGAYTVTAQGQSVGDIQTAANATLSINGGTFTASAGRTVASQRWIGWIGCGRQLTLRASTAPLRSRLV